MSSVIAPIPIPETEPALIPAARGSTLLWLRGNAWGLFDQVLISGSNFITMVLTARALNPDSEAFGQFSLVYSAMLFVNVLQSTLITQPHNVLGSTRRGEDYQRYTSATGVGQVLMLLVLGMVALSVAGVGRLAGWQIAPLLLALAPSIVAWQLQEFFRRILYTEGRLAAAFWNDVVSYGGQSLAVAILYATERLSGVSAFYTLSITSLLGALLGLWQVRGSLGKRLDIAAFIENWHFGKWLAGAEILQWCSSLHMYLYIAAIILGTRASGELKAAQILFGPARIFAFFLGTVLPIRFAKTHFFGGNNALHGQFKSAALLVAPGLGAYCLFVALFGESLLRVLYKNAFAGSGVLLALYSLAALLSYLELFVQAVLTATKRTRYVFLGYVYGGVIAFVVSWPIIAWLGVHGAVLCMILTAVVVNVLFWRAYRREIMVESADVVERDVDATEAVERGAITGSGEILTKLLAVFERNKIPYCLLHGYRDFPQRITKDVDCLLPRWVVNRRLPRMLHVHRREIGADVVQWLADESPLVILSGTTGDGRPTWLPLHITTKFSLNHLMFYSDEEIIATRRQVGPFWVPAAQIEFACLLINRMIKGNIGDSHRRDLVELYQEDAWGCRHEIERFWSAGDAELIVDLIERESWDELTANLPRLRMSLLLRRALRQPVATIVARAMHVYRRARRFVRPEFGLHVVFLGPDGVGKSTIIDAVGNDVAPAFVRSGYQTFAPSLLPARMQPKKGTPHELPPRSLPASLLKAAWWLICYTAGYVLSVQMVRGRAGVVLCHRYLLDALVDSRRYRYGGPKWLLHAIWKIAPKPDLIVLLDAPPEIIQQRKQEVPLEETARQQQAYRELVEPLANARIVDASQPLAKVVSDVDQVIVEFLALRAALRFQWGGLP